MKTLLSKLTTSDRITTMGMMWMDSIWVLDIVFKISMKFHWCLQRMVVRFASLACAAGLMLSTELVFAAVYMSPVDFVNRSFDQTPTMKTLWLKTEHQQAAKDVLGHSYPGIRLRYWQRGETTAWILDEIGKEKPITIGIVITDNKIRDVSILEFREPRGGEVRHPFFTRQFKGLFLKANRKLSQRIDGVAGATLSVRAVSNVTRYALFLHTTLLSRQNQYAHQKVR